MSDSPVSGSPQDWLRHARSDLELARIDPPAAVLHEALCFHAQQAAEKAIKAVLLHHGVRFPYTHDIKRLLEMLPAKVSLPEPVLKSAELSIYAVLTRYPADLGAITKAEYDEAVRLAQAVVKWAEEMLHL